MVIAAKSNFADFQLDQFSCDEVEPNSPSSVADQLVGEAWKQVSTISDYARSLLPSLEIVKSPLSAVLDKAIESVARCAQPARRESDWTLMLNLTTDFDQDEDGKFYRLEDLRDYAKQTKGTGLTIVVQAAFLQEEATKSKPAVYSLERYVVKDGTITKVLDGASNGYGKDLEALVAYTGKNHPSRNMALIMDSHGLGNEGLFGDTGNISVDDFVTHVQTGLKGTDRTKLDMVHFDSCYMAQSGVMARVAKVADHMVASSESESSEGISLLPVFDTLKDNKVSDAKTLGRALVREARLQYPEFLRTGADVPIDTISSVDLRQYETFRKSLDALGDKLADALKDPKNLPVLENAIDSSRKFGRAGAVDSLTLNFKPDRYRVDLKDFVNNVVAAIEDGRLTDDDRSIRRSALAVLEERSKLVDSSFGYAKNEGHGGVSVFLPGRDLRNLQEEARRRIPPGRIQELSRQNNFAGVNASDQSRAEFVKRVTSELEKMRTELFPCTAILENERKAVADALGEFSTAKTNENRQKAFATIHATSSLLSGSQQFNQAKEEAVLELRKNANKLFTAQLDEGGAAGWSRFRAAVSRRDTKTSR